MRKTLTQDRLRALLHYDPSTGVFTWLVQPNGRVPAGAEAGTIDRKGYRKIQIDKRIYVAGPLAVLYMTGAFPAEGMEVDHISECGPKSDNRWTNLRVGTKSQNQHNQRANPARSGCGHRCVCFHKAAGKFQGHVRVNGRRKHLGLFSNAQDADEFVSLARAMLMPSSPDARRYG